MSSDKGQAVQALVKHFATSPSKTISCNLSIMDVTIKQLVECVTQPKFRGRFVISSAQVFSVRVVGMLTAIKGRDNWTDFTIYDGTGSIDGTVWNDSWVMEFCLKDPKINQYYEFCGSLSAELSSAKLDLLNVKKVENYNRITEHMLSAITQHVQLSDQALTEFPSKAAETSRSSRISMDLDKEALIWLMAEDEIKVSESGASFRYLVDKMHISEDAVRKLLEELLSECSVYNTIDEHYKLCLDLN